MPTPPTALVNALRNGSVARHVFFRMTHTSGNVLAWDGVGKFVFNSETYLGVQGFASVEGVSDSGDIQNHEILVKLNGVSLRDISDINPNIQQEAAKLTVAWIQENGTVLASRVVFDGKGDVLITKVDEDTRSLTAKLRAPLAEWSSPPRAYYTPADQARRYPDDDGFKFVKSLENANISGWGPVTESSGSTAKLYGYKYRSKVVSGNYYTYDGYLLTYARDSISDKIIGDNLRGLNQVYRSTKCTRLFSTQQVQLADAFWKEKTTTAAITASSQALSANMRVGGNNVYVDAAGAVRSAGGKLLVYENGDTKNLRLAGTITGNGTATGNLIGRKEPTLYNVGSSFFTTFNWRHIGKNGGVYAGDELAQVDTVICNYYGNSVVEQTSNGRIKRMTFRDDVIDATPTSTATFAADTYVEDVTGATVEFVGSTLKVGGSNCTISTTGVVLTPGGRRVVNNSVAGGKAFLRVFT